MKKKDVFRNGALRSGREESLGTIFKSWTAPDPAPDFQAAVWRRIGMIGLSEPRTGWFPVQFNHWVPKAVAALFVGALVGAGIGRALPSGAAGEYPDAALLHPRTVAGSYLLLLTGDR